MRILQSRESISQGDEEQEVLSIEPSLQRQLSSSDDANTIVSTAGHPACCSFYQKIPTAITQPTSAPSTSIPATMTQLEFIEQRLQSLRKEKDRIIQLEDRLGDPLPLTKEELEVLPTITAVTRCILDLETLSVLFMPSRKVQRSADPPAYHPGENERYLCVSNGFTICCFDLKQSKDEPKEYSCHVPKVASKIFTLELLPSGFPFSLGLFRLGSNTYMMGGQQFPDFKDSNFVPDHEGCYRSDWELFSSLYDKYGVKGGSSSKIYALSLREDGRLELQHEVVLSQLSSSNPKFWPIVDKIGDNIHVIGTRPSVKYTNRIKFPRVIGCHDVLNPKGVWTGLSPVPHDCISRHLVVGCRLFAGLGSFTREFVFFDIETNEWGEREHVGNVRGSRVYIKHVAEIFGNGFGKCIGEFQHGDSSVTNPLYVVFAVILPRFTSDRDSMVAVAYLVTADGYVLCFQRLNNFFLGFQVLPKRTEGVVISCCGEQEKTVWLVFQGRGNDVLIVNFTWEEADDGIELLSGLREKAMAMAMEDDVCKAPPFIEEEDFLKVVVNGYYVSQFGTGLHSGDVCNTIPTRLSACFI